MEQLSDIYSMRVTLEYIFEGFPSIQHHINELFAKHELNNIKADLKETRFKLNTIESIKWELKKRPKLDRAVHNLYYKIRK